MNFSENRMANSHARCVLEVAKAQRELSWLGTCRSHTVSQHARRIAAR